MYFLRAYTRVTACVFCGRVKEGIVCSACRTHFCCRHPPFCARCGIRLVSEDTYCGSCRVAVQEPHDMPGFIHSRWAYNEYTQFLSKEFKKNGNRLLGYHIATEIKKYLEELHLFNAHTCIIPLPANPAHVRDVGFDHMRVLCRYLRHMGGISVYPCIARRESKAQKTLGKADRKKNMQQSLYLRTPAATHFTMAATLLKYTHIVLLDDIVTTGASLLASASLLTPLHQAIAAKLWLVSLIRNEY